MASLIYHGLDLYPLFLYLPIILVFIRWLSLTPQVSHQALLAKFLSGPAPLAVSVIAEKLPCLLAGVCLLQPSIFLVC